MDMEFTPRQIRTEFEKHIGRKKYIDFVLTLYEAFPLRNKLLHWQEILLKSYFDKLGIEDFNMSFIYELFNLCPIHDTQLKSDTVPIIDGNGLPFEEATVNDAELYPLANVKAPRDLERFTYPNTVDVLYCEKCRSMLAQRLE